MAARLKGGGKALAIVAALIVLLAGCGSSDDSTVEPDKTAGAVNYQRTGGVAAMVEMLAINPSGAATLKTGFPGNESTSSFTVPKGQLDSLHTALDKADLGSLGIGNTGGCADCFIYDIVYRGQHAVIVESDIPAKVKPALDQLEAIVAAH